MQDNQLIACPVYLTQHLLTEVVLLMMATIRHIIPSLQTYVRTSALSARVPIGTPSAQHEQCLLPMSLAVTRSATDAMMKSEATATS